jgi:large subunit ribosomal protein L4
MIGHLCGRLGRLSVSTVSRGPIPAITRCLNSVTIPQNLQLDDLSAVLVEEEKASIKEEEFSFPLLNVPESMKVAKFLEPGAFSDKEFPLNPKLFGVAIRKDIVHEVIRYQRAKARQPKKTKRVGEISGSKKKPRPQKGQGLSQVGNKRNSAWRGGMKAHGPVIRDYSFNLNRKVRAMGMMIVIAAKHREGNLLVVDEIKVENNKTKELLQLLRGHDLDDTMTVYVDNDFNMEFALASRNLTQVFPMLQTQLNVYDLVRREKLVISASALEELQARLLHQYTYSGKRAFFHIQRVLLDEGRDLA